MLKKSPHMSGSAQFKPMLFKGQLNLWCSDHSPRCSNYSLSICGMWRPMRNFSYCFVFCLSATNIGHAFQLHCSHGNKEGQRHLLVSRVTCSVSCHLGHSWLNQGLASELKVASKGRKTVYRGALVAQSVKHLTSAQALNDWATQAPCPWNSNYSWLLNNVGVKSTDSLHSQKSAYNLWFPLKLQILIVYC